MDRAFRLRSNFIVFISAVLVISLLYVARELLIPLALASLFTFLLNPLVKRLLRWSLPRVVAVVTVTMMCFSTLALIAWLLGGELASLASELPAHRQNIRTRIESLQKLGELPVVRNLRQLAGDMQHPATHPSAEVGPPAPTATAPPPPTSPTKEVDPSGGLMKILNALVPTLANALGTASVVILFVFFMLLRLNEINQRVVQLAGFSRLTVTTKAIEEAGERVSRYLLMQGTVNCLYGILLAIGLFLLGLPYVVLWGALAAMFRFIPYVGPWIVAVLPIGLSLAVFDGWTLPLMVTGLIVGLELMTNMVLEPVLYGHSVGVSDFSLLVAIAFWTWLWGGVGLVLATPLTVCIVVFCKYIPTLSWVDIVMGESLVVQPHLKYYQHHVADDEAASHALIDAAVKKNGMEKTVDEVILPAIALTRVEEASRKLTSDEASQIYEAMRSAFTLVSEVDKSRPRLEQPANLPDNDAVDEAPPIAVLGRALHGAADELALDVLSTMLPGELTLELSSEPMLIGELVDLIERTQPAALCISAMPPQAQAAAGILCRRLRSRLPHLKILVCLWILPGKESHPESLVSAGATWAVSTMKEARDILADLASTSAARPS